MFMIEEMPHSYILTMLFFPVTIRYQCNNENKMNDILWF